VRLLEVDLQQLIAGIVKVRSILTHITGKVIGLQMPLQLLGAEKPLVTKQACRMGWDLVRVTVVHVPDEVLLSVAFLLTDKSDPPLYSNFSVEHLMAVFHVTIEQRHVLTIRLSFTYGSLQA
jgi:hypothetical protein